MSTKVDLDAPDALYAAAGQTRYGTSTEWLDAIHNQYPALAAEIRELRSDLDRLTRGAYSLELARLSAENERLRGRVRELEGALSSLQAILCDPEGTPCFAGSDGDRRVAVDAFAALTPKEGL